MADGNRSELHELLDRIPDQEIETAREYLRSLVDPLVDPVRAALRAAPEDDEPLSAQDRTALAEAERRNRRGEPTISHDEILREFGLTKPER